MQELKPCPFCGGEPYLRTEFETNRFFSYWKYRIQCGSCGSVGEIFTCFNFEDEVTKNKAIDAWNRRA